MSNNQKVLNLVFLAMFLGIMLVMGLVPFLGFIPFGAISITILHIPVIIAAFYFGPKLGTLTGLGFGVISMIIAFMRPTGIMDFFFQNPLISVVPRVVFAFLTSLVFFGLNRFIKNRYLSSVVAAVIGSLLHSVLVLGAIAILKFPEVSEAGTFNAAIIVALSTLGTFSLLEAAAAGIIAPPIVKALEIISGKQEHPSDLLTDSVDHDNL